MINKESLITFSISHGHQLFCMCVVCFFSASDLLKKNEELTKERDQLSTTAESLREKLNGANATQQEIEAQRENALENISQVDMFKILWTLNGLII